MEQTGACQDKSVICLNLSFLFYEMGTEAPVMPGCGGDTRWELAHSRHAMTYYFLLAPPSLHLAAS